MFNDSCQTNALPYFTVGRIMAVDDKSEISFSIPQGMLLWQPILLLISTEQHGICVLGFHPQN